MSRMKRFTRVFEDYHVVNHRHIHRDRFDNFAGPAVEKLAEYEDTALTPMEVRTQQRELTYIRSEREILLRRVAEQEREITALKSEREYFRSRADFFQQVAGEK